jgi:ectoine hydroxylase-related dioxygenase (phytanoyl-CoA dioxygenase family)
MLSADQKKHFEEKGYLLVPGVLNKDEVAQIRAKVLEIFDTGAWKKSPYNTKLSLSDVFETFPEFIDYTLKPKVLEVVSGLLGENPLLMPESAIHYRLYTPWHKDTTSQERAGHTFHHKKESLMIEAGFYMQDNDEFGGGLTVMEGSHFTDDNFVPPPVNPTLVERALNKVIPTPEAKNKKINPHKHILIDIPSKAGDLVIFNFKVNHRATLPKHCKPNELPKEKEKIAFFNAFSRNNQTAYDYLNYLKSRPEAFYQNLQHRVVSPQLLAKAKELKFTAL